MDKEKLTDRQRILLLEEQVDLLMEYAESYRDTKQKL